MVGARRIPLLALPSLLLACSATPPSAPPTPPPPNSTAAPAQATPAQSRAEREPQRPTAARACGELSCQAFESPLEAFAYVLARKPRVLAVGEAHAQRGSANVHSATRRFGQLLLPALEGRASDIVIELLIASGRCGKAREEAVAERQRPATDAQAKPNQNEFVTLGTAAKSLRIAPHALEPSCEQYQAVLDSGQDDIAKLLELITELTAENVERLLSAKQSGEQIVLTYGGLRHNDLVPKPQMEAWSFGPRLSQRSRGRYVELDLIVPEFIKDSEAWRAMPWYSHYDAETLGRETILFEPHPSSFVLVFPRTAPPAAVPAQAPTPP